MLSRDLYLYEGTNVLRNKFGIKIHKFLAFAE